MLTSDWSSAVLPSFSRIQSRLNPVPESLNSPDIAPGELWLAVRISLDYALFSHWLSVYCLKVWAHEP